MKTISNSCKRNTKDNLVNNENIPEIRFNFDGSWNIKNIKSFADIVGGGTPSTTIDEYWDGDINWFTPTEVGQTKYVFDSQRKITKEGLNKSSAKLLPKNTILLTTRATIGRVSITNSEATTNQGFQSVICKNVDLNFMYYLLQTLEKTLIRKSVGSTFLEISKKEIENIEVNIPSIEEQKKIGEFISLLDKKIALMEKKYNCLIKTKKYFLKNLFCYNENIPNLRFHNFIDVWKDNILDDIADKIGDGLHSTPKYVDDSNYYFINGNNLDSGKIIINENTKCVNKEEYEKYYIRLNDNSILLSINGTIGNLSFFNNEKVVLGKSSAYINLKSDISKYYIYNLLQTERIKFYFNNELTGSTIKNLSLKSLKETPIKIPTKDEQNKIASFLFSIDQKIELMEKKIKYNNNFKEILLSKMFC